MPVRPQSTPPPSSKPTKIRLDQLLVDRSLADSREKARAMILAGEVTVDGQRSDKPGRQLPADSDVHVAARMPYVSRGGYKLAAALDHFRIDPAGRTCVDIGASTGGFTDCLLQRGAAAVWTFDVGHNQLAWKLRSDPRVAVHEGVNVRHLDPASIPQRFSLAVCDASFISATMLIPVLAALLEPEPAASPRASPIKRAPIVSAEMIILVKPQFEAGREQVGKGGIVRDPAVHQAACARVRTCVERLGFAAQIIDSPILGAEGNREFLLYAKRA